MSSRAGAAGAAGTAVCTRVECRVVCAPSGSAHKSLSLVILCVTMLEHDNATIFVILEIKMYLKVKRRPTRDPIYLWRLQGLALLGAQRPTACMDTAPYICNRAV